MLLIESTSIDESDPIWAIAVSESSNSPMKFKLGAVVVKRGKVLGFGYNNSKTHPKFGSKDNFKTMHAEGSALYCAKKLGNNVAGATMIVYRRNGLISKPCNSCEKMLKDAGIAKVIYTNEPRHIS
jgi:deoxycytidylate deaminase